MASLSNGYMVPASGAGLVTPAGQVAGFWDVIRSIGTGAQRVGSWAYGAARTATNLGRTVATYIRDPQRAQQWQDAMSAATTVADQLLVFQNAVRDVQVQLGRQLTPAEVAQLEQGVWGAAGPPNQLPGNTPAVSPTGPDLGAIVPVLLIGAVVLGTRKLLPLALAGGAFWYLSKR